MEMELIIKFIILTFVISGGLIFMLHRALISGTEGAVKRLNDENAKLQAKQEELNLKIKEANEELSKRQKEARELSNKMRSDAEQESLAEREKIINKARQEGEEIIAKAQGNKEKMKQDMEKENDIRMLKFGMEILNDILSEKAKSALNDVLLEEYLEKLKDIDMSMISPEVKSVEIVTLSPLKNSDTQKISDLIKGKLGREIALNASVDQNIGGGIILKFGSMALDGSIQSLIREKGADLAQQIET